MASEEQKAYIAGYLDGEGAIMGYRKGETLVVHVAISSCVKESLDFIFGLYGGNLCEAKNQRKNPRRARDWRLQLVNKQAERLLRDVLPFLIVKREHAKVALALRRRPKYWGGRKVPEEEQVNRQHLINKLKLLNRKGPRGDQMIMELKGDPQPSLMEGK